MTFVGWMVVIAAVALCAAPSAGAVDELYVDAAAGEGGDGSLARPLVRLADAIAQASPGAVIHVAAGTYGAVAIDGKPLTVLGGYPGGDAGFGTRAPAEHESRIVGDATSPAVRITGAAVTVDGFTLTGGRRGVLVREAGTPGAPVVIAHSVIAGNDAGDEVGGGVYAVNCALRVVASEIRDNRADKGGGLGSYCDWLRIEDNLVARNTADNDHGGGLYVASRDVEITGNVVDGNAVGVRVGYGWGGGIVVFDERTRARLSGNVWTNNRAPARGGAIFIDDGAHAALAHELVYGNPCTKLGSPAILVDGLGELGSYATLDHVTVAEHDCPTEGNAIEASRHSTVVVTNSIFWRNGRDFAARPDSNIAVTYSATSTSVAGTGNLSADPRFVDPESGDFRLRPGSPCLNAADPQAPFDREPASGGGRADMGRYGNTPDAGPVEPGDADPESDPPDGGDSSGAESARPGGGCCAGGAAAFARDVAAPVGLGFIVGLAPMRRRRRRTIFRSP
jgi:hypothetical protein